MSPGGRRSRTSPNRTVYTPPLCWLCPTTHTHHHHPPAHPNKNATCHARSVTHDVDAWLWFCRPWCAREKERQRIRLVSSTLQLYKFTALSSRLTINELRYVGQQYISSTHNHGTHTKVSLSVCVFLRFRLVQHSTCVSYR